jgi:hypothetical protein
MFGDSERNREMKSASVVMLDTRAERRILLCVGLDSGHGHFVSRFLLSLRRQKIAKHGPRRVDTLNF